MATDLIGGRYQLDELLGRGGMSEVWCAEDQELGRRVALKLLAPDADRERFAREARAAAALAHPNITQLYDYGEADGRPFMVLEYLPGGTLEERLVPGEPLDDAETTRVANDIAAGLAHAHMRGLVHRDLKPANVLFDSEGRAKIADFGIARLGHGGTLTEAGTVLGTAAYISPEQAAGEPATPASDVYSFGVILYRLLTGRLPFVSDDALTLVSLHRDATPPPLEQFRADAPATLAAVTATALAKDPAARPADGTALAAALGEGGTGTAAAAVAAGAAVLADQALADTASTRVLPAAAAPPPAAGMAPSGASPSPPRRRRGPVALLAALALLAAGGTALAFTLTHSSGGGPGFAPAATLPPSAGKHAKAKQHGATTAASTAASTVKAATTTTTTTTAARTATRPRHVPTGTTISLPTPTTPVTTTPPATTSVTTTPPTTAAATTIGP